MFQQCRNVQRNTRLCRTISGSSKFLPTLMWSLLGLVMLGGIAAAVWWFISRRKVRNGLVDKDAKVNVIELQNRRAPKNAKFEAVEVLWRQQE